MASRFIAALLAFLLMLPEAARADTISQTLDAREAFLKAQKGIKKGEAAIKAGVIIYNMRKLPWLCPWAEKEGQYGEAYNDAGVHSCCVTLVDGLGAPLIAEKIIDREWMPKIDAGKGRRLEQTVIDEIRGKIDEKFFADISAQLELAKAATIDQCVANASKYNVETTE